MCSCEFLRNFWEQLFSQSTCGDCFWDYFIDIDNLSGAEESDHAIFSDSGSDATLASESSSESGTAGEDESYAPVSDDTY